MVTEKVNKIINLMHSLEKRNKVGSKSSRSN